MRPGSCCEGDINPFRREPLCVSCNDSRNVTKTASARREDGDIVLCPSCGTRAQRDALWMQRSRELYPLPELRVSDLTDEEASIFRDWRVQNHHELDCLRWIEGRRYDAQKDPEFMNRCRIELAKWRLLSGHDKPAAEEEAPW